MRDSLRGTLPMVLALGLAFGPAPASAQDSQGLEGAAVENANRESRPLGQGGSVARTTTRVTVPEPGSFEDSSFWVPANWLPSNRRHPRLQQTPLVRNGLPQDRLPWSYQWWPSNQADLAFRGSYPMSPLEKLDTAVANHRASGSNVAGANPGVAGWEADPENKHNTAQIVGPGGSTERTWKEIADQIRGVSVQDVGSGSTGSGTLTVVVEGTSHRVTRRESRQWYDKAIEVFEYDSGYQGRSNWVTWVPGDGGQGGTWWHVYWYVDGYGYLRQHGYQGASVQVQGSGNTGGGDANGWPRARLTHQGRTYDVVKVTDQWQGTPIDVFFYKSDAPSGAPPNPAFPEGQIWNRFVAVPSLEVARERNEPPQWVHVRWEFTERQGGVQWEGHCMGYAAASVLFREPPNQKVYRAPGNRRIQLLRLKARRAEEAHRGNLGYESAGTADSLVFGNRDLKGIATVLAQAFGTSFDYPDRPAPYEWADFGTPVREGATQAAYDDILPHHMHRIFIDFLKERRKPVVMDYSQDESIFNAAVFYYEFQVTGFRASPRPSYRIESMIGYAGYGEGDDQRETQPLYWRLAFDVFLDGNNRVVGSQWVGENQTYHPDFIWVPVELKDPKVQLGRYDGNPRIPRDWVLQNLLVDAQGRSLLRSR